MLYAFVSQQRQRETSDKYIFYQKTHRSLRTYPQWFLLICFIWTKTTKYPAKKFLLDEISFIMKLNWHQPVWVLMCRFNRLGRSKVFPHTSHGSRARSPRVVRDFGEHLWIELSIPVSIRSPVQLAADDDVEDSPDTDLCSSSPPDIGEMGNRTRDMRDIDKSKGESRYCKESSFSSRIKNKNVTKKKQSHIQHQLLYLF